MNDHAERSTELDRAIIEGRLDLGGVDLVDELVSLSRDEIARQLTEVDLATAHRQATPLRRAAHAISGSSATIGATRVTATAAQIEVLASSGDLEGAGPLVVELTRRWALAVSALEEQAAGRRTPPGHAAAGRTGTVPGPIKGSS